MSSLKVLRNAAMILLATALLTGCAHHLNQAECQNLDLKQYGFNDGAQGKLQSTLSNEIKDCSRFNITLDTKAYQRGWKTGVRQFCRVDNGYQLGVNGTRFNNVCPRDLAGKFESAWRRGLRRYCVPGTGYNLGRSGKPFPNFCASNQVVAFRNSYDDGLRLFRAEASVKGDMVRITADINRKNNRINELRDSIRRWEKDTRAVEPNGRPLYMKRRVARDSIRDARWEIRQLRDEIARLDLERDRVQDRLTQLQTA